MQVTAWSTGPVPGPDHVLGQEKWLRVPNPREGSGLMERLLEIFIDEVKFIVFLKPISFLLGEKREGTKEGGERRERNIR